jgi:NTE family protein
MGDIGSGDFARVAEAIPLGTEAANSQADQLRRYSMPEAEYLAWRQSVTSPVRSTVTFADIQIDGTDRVNPDYVRAQVRSRPGVETTEQRIADDTSRIFALGDFEAVEYRLAGDPDTPTLQIGVKEKSWGPNFLSFDLGLAASSGGDTAFVLRGEHLRTWVNPAGGQWRNTIQLGRTALLQSSLYQPVDARHRFFVEPGIRATRSLEDVYADGDRIARYDLREGHVGFDGGLALGTLAELRLGLRYGLADASVDTGAADLPEVDSATEAGWVARFVYDSRDAPFVPTRGTIGRLRYLRSHESLGSDFSYESLEAGVMHMIPFRGDVLYVGAAGGTDFSSDLPPYRFFRMGGYRSFPGLEAGELRGGEYWTGTALYLWKLADIQSLFGQALYGGIRLQAGEMMDRIDGIDDGTIYGASINVGGRTPLGPVVITLGGTTNDSFNLYFSLGRPIEEGSIWDDIQ